MPQKPRQPQDKYILRLPDGMRDRIAAAAKANNRSMNAEIVATLLKAYPDPDIGTYIDTLDRLLNNKLIVDGFNEKDGGELIARLMRMRAELADGQTPESRHNERRKKPPGKKT